jgi:cytoskeletal protein CcmA (bactofilin family)
MFGKEKEKEEKKRGGEVAGFIGKGMSIEGKLSFAETARVDGSFKGEISATGTLVVGDGGYVEGDIKAGSAIITGTVKGTLEATTRVELRSPARFTGDIKTPTLIIDEGVVFEGTCTMVKKDASYETVQYGEAGQGSSFVQ